MAPSSLSLFKTRFCIVLGIIFLLLPKAYCTEPPFLLPDAQELNHIRSALLETSKGKIVFELFPKDAPWHVANFKFLADKGYYRGLIFHIREPEFIVQGGGPRDDPARRGPYSLPAEFNDRKHERGMLGMARISNEVNPDRSSDGVHFHILLGTAPHMDGRYTIFGRVVSGMDVVEKLRKGDRIINLTAFVRQDP